MQVVVQRLSFTQELGREDDVLGSVARPQLGRAAHGNGRLDDHHGVGVDLDDVADHRFH
jgi:hypothetical protein